MESRVFLPPGGTWKKVEANGGSDENTRRGPNLWHSVLYNKECILKVNKNRIYVKISDIRKQ